MFVQELTRTKSVSVETQHLPPVPGRHMPKSIHRKDKHKMAKHMKIKNKVVKMFKNALLNWPRSLEERS